MTRTERYKLGRLVRCNVKPSEYVFIQRLHLRMANQIDVTLTPEESARISELYRKYERQCETLQWFERGRV